jgi:hypothetical protein
MNPMPNPKKLSRQVRTVSAKEVSVLAWIQDAYGNVLLIQQTAGRQLWSLPGGKVRSVEAGLAPRDQRGNWPHRCVGQSSRPFRPAATLRSRRSLPDQAAQGPPEAGRYGNPKCCLHGQTSSQRHSIGALFLVAPVCAGHEFAQHSGIVSGLFAASRHH